MQVLHRAARSDNPTSDQAIIFDCLSVFQPETTLHNTYVFTVVFD